MGEFVKVARKSEVPTDSGKLVQINGQDIALFKVNDKIYAIYNTCPHQGGPLAEGGLDGKMVTCPWHGWEFDVTSGKCSFNDTIRQPTFQVKEDGDDIFLEV